MKKNLKLYIGLAILGFASSCAPSLEEYQEAKGSADFTKYVAIGNSLTSGYADGGLYLEGQQVAFPNLIAEQMKSVGGGTFTSPFFSNDQANGSGYIRLKAMVDGNPVTENVTTNLAIRGVNGLGKPLYTKFTDAVNNIGVPGMRLDLAYAPQFGSSLGNPYFERLLSDTEAGSKSYLDYSTSHEHTFFSFWLGNNDVLGYATNGAVENPLDPTTKLTSETQFAQLYANYLNKLTENNRKGVVATIPDVTAVPYFKTVTVARINAALAANPNTANLKLLIRTKTQVRPATDEDLIGLTFKTDTIGKTNANGPFYGLSPNNPLSDQQVLDKDEVAAITAHTLKLNKIITDVAKEKGVALADTHGFLNKVKAGYIYNGVGISSSYITGNVFSLDGIHLTPMGNAIVANLFIDAINSTYNSKISKIDISTYRGVKFPDGQ